MKLEKLANSINKPFEKVASKWFNLYDHYLLGVNNDELNPEIPFLVEEDWRRNSNLMGNYFISAFMVAGIGLSSACFGIKEAFDAFNHFTDFCSYIVNNTEDAKNSYIFTREIVKNLGKECAWAVISGTSLGIMRNFSEKIEFLAKKRENKYNIPKSF